MTSFERPLLSGAIDLGSFVSRHPMAMAKPSSSTFLSNELTPRFMATDRPGHGGLIVRQHPFCAGAQFIEVVEAVEVHCEAQFVADMELSLR
jgi:hypothetical protein